MNHRLATSVMACLFGAIVGPAKAADLFYIGTWKLDSAVVAPWADPKQKPDATEKTRLLGKTVVFKARGIAGPQPFACAAPNYKVSNFTPDMIFQGAFDTTQVKDANKMAASLGFSGTVIKTLETGCELDFHFVDDTTAEVGLNDYVYTLKKQ
jgi:hypothetical protein